MMFENIPVSTQTYIAKSNLKLIDLDSLSDKIEITKKILTVRYKNKIKGFSVNISKNFLNCITMNIFLDKKINTKIFNNGVFQITGCKNYKHAKDSIITIWNAIKKYNDCFTITGDNLTIYIISAMRNVDFELGFKVNREALGIYIHKNTEYKIPPMNKGYMGVKIKILLDNVNDLIINKLLIKNNDILNDTLTYKKYLTVIAPDLKKLNKQRFISISVFQNGKVLMSGIDLSYQILYYNWFINLIEKIKDEIQVKIIEKKTFKIPSYLLSSLDEKYNDEKEKPICELTPQISCQ